MSDCVCHLTAEDDNDLDLVHRQSSSDPETPCPCPQTSNNYMKNRLTRHMWHSPVYSPNPPTIAVLPLMSSSKTQTCCSLVNIDAECWSMSAVHSWAAITAQVLDRSSPNLYEMYMYHHCLKCAHQHFYHDMRLEMPARQIKIVGRFSPNNNTCIKVHV